MKIRQAKDKDLSSLLALFSEHAAFEKAAQPDANMPALADALFGSPPALYIWVIENGSELYGFASATLEFSTWRTRHYFHLDCLYLKPEIRGQGWGRQLMQVVQKKGADLGCDELQWQTPVWNSAAEAFYKHMGAHAVAKSRFHLPIEL